MANIKTKRSNRPKKQRDIYLILILLLALFLYGWNIWNAGSANTYYTAAIKSMTLSWHNFWYGAFDPAGFITVDKPPVALWFMAISAKIFGVHGWSVVLPSVLFGVGSVYLIYKMIQPKFGPIPARLAALAMTLTPIVVADSRTNNMDATLIFFLLLAGRYLQKSVDRQKIRDLLISFALIGIAFNIKMLQAYMVVPAMLLYYWLATRKKWPKKLGWAAIAMGFLAIFTLIWPLAVDNTDTSKRPYVGSSETNSVMELAFGYNGTQRLLGQSTGTNGRFPGMGNQNSKSKETMNFGASYGGYNLAAPSGNTPGNQSNTPPTNGTGPGSTGGHTNGQATTQNAPQPPNGQSNGQSQNQTPPSGMSAGYQPNGTKAGNPPSGTKMKGQQKGGPGANGGGGGGAFDIGTAGITRIFQTSLGRQVSWLLPFAIIGSISAFAYYYDRKKRWYQLSAPQKELLYWAGWLVPVFGFFSVASFFHPYYMIMLAPPIAALFGIGAYTSYQQFKHSDLRKWQTYLLPLAFLTTVALQAYYVYAYYPWLTWLLVAAGIGLTILGFGLRSKRHFKKIGLTALVALLLAPGWWSLTPTLASESAQIPTAGPDLLTQGKQGSGGMMDSSISNTMLTYLLKHQGNAKYLFATADTSAAAPVIIKTGKAVMAIGGFNGTDPSLTLKQFKKLVAKGEVKYYLASGKSSNNAIANWVAKHGKAVQLSSSQTTTTKTSQNQQPGGGGMGGQQGTLYDLSTALSKD